MWRCFRKNFNGFREKFIADEKHIHIFFPKYVRFKTFGSVNCISGLRAARWYCDSRGETRTRSGLKNEDALPHVLHGSLVRKAAA